MATLRNSLSAVISVILITPQALFADSAVGWRGDGTGRYPQAKPALHWSADDNVAWKTEMPGGSPATPVVAGGKVFAMSDPFLLICVQASDGKILWQRGHAAGDLGAAGEGAGRLDMAHNPDGHAGSAASTPASDGKQVFAIFANGIVSCHDLDGNRKWVRFVEKPKTGYGHSASPLLIGDLLVVQFIDLIALDAATGVERWRAALPASHATPVAAKVGGADLIVHPAGAILRAGDGRILASDLFALTESSPVVDGDAIYAHENGMLKAFGLPAKLAEPLAVAKRWETAAPRGQYQIASPVAHDGLIYTASIKGDWQVTDAKTGEVAYSKRLPFAGRVYVSVQLAGGRLFVTDQTGKTYVLKPGRAYAEDGVNELDYHPTSSAFAGGRRFVRTHRHLICVGD